MTAALDGFVIEPTEPEIDRAAAIICGCDLINAMDQETAGNFHMFVQEVLETTVGEEIRRMKAERLKLDRRIHNQRVALRDNWEIVEMRRKWLGSETARKSYIWLLKRYKALKAEHASHTQL